MTTLAPVGRAQALPARARARLAPLGAWLGLPILALLVYTNALAAPFVFDDVPQIVANPELEPIWPGFVPFLRRQRTFTTLTFAWNRALGGLDPLGYHLVNVGLHALAGVCVSALVRSTLRLPRLAPRFGAQSTP